MSAATKVHRAQTAPCVNIHASCVAVDGAGILLRGPSGSGKSDLALRLIEGGAELVADDRVDLRRDGDRLIAAPPPILAGLVEAVGIGPIAVPHRSEVIVALVVDLVPRAAVERLPEPASETLLGIDVPCFNLDAFGASTPAKLRLLASGAHFVDTVLS